MDCDVDPLSLKSWGLPAGVVAAYAAQQVRSLYAWQARCLTQPGVLQGGNLVFTAPTSSGKTLVAELLVLKRVLESPSLETRRKAMVVVPYVALAREKRDALQEVWCPCGLRVGGFMSGECPTGGFAGVDVAVCTLEAANGLINRLVEEDAVASL
ncbi:unnamed protein product, partial [Lampetra fluviatilis]